MDPGTASDQSEQKLAGSNNFPCKSGIVTSLLTYWILWTLRIWPGFPTHLQNGYGQVFHSVNILYMVDNVGMVNMVMYKWGK